MEYSFFMIKPIAYEHRDEILDIIRRKLEIVSTTDAILTKDFLNELYKNEDAKFRDLNAKCLMGQKACLGVVRGKNAKNDLVEICGKEPIGKNCSHDSIRYKFRTDAKTESDGLTFYYNAIHKSDPKDANDEVKLYIRKILSKQIEDFYLKKRKEVEEYER